MILSFEPRQDGPGLEIVDHVEGRQCTVQTPGPVDPVETSVEDFQFPVDRGVTFEAGAVTVPHRTSMFIWNSLGFQIQELANGESVELPEDRYVIDMSVPVKLYLVVEASLTADVSSEGVELGFGEQSQVLLGARSYHKHPAGTITTTEDPEDMMAAVSALGSALKTTSVERSYPTLRGHPPTIELGEELAIPAGIESPDTGVTIEIPPELRYVYIVAPLAYYLGADVVSGPIPKLVTSGGFEHELDGTARGFEGEVERVLKQVFFLDCLTRTEGFYPINLHERNVLENDLDLDFPGLYDVSIADQIAAYLTVPFEVIEPELPEWKLTAHVSMTPKHVEVLPFLVNDLAVVRSPRSQEAASGMMPATGEDLTRAGDFTRSSTSGETAVQGETATPNLVRPEATGSLEEAWFGDGAPIGGSKAMLEAYRNRLAREPNDGDIDITVVCNDTAMNDERDIVDDIYGSRDELPFDVQGYHELTVEELRAVLEQECDFLHYIGHIDGRGFECADGFLDAKTLDRTGVEAFLLNACTSYQQGMELIRAGSIAGVVTVEDVINSGAERIGSTMAKLLNHGFPFSTALNLARDESIVGGLYLVLGDGAIDIAQAQSGIPSLCSLTDDGSLRLTYRTYPTADKGLGCITIPYVGNNDEFYIAAGKNGEFELTQSELKEFLEMETMPIKYANKLHWSDNIDLDELL